MYEQSNMWLRPQTRRIALSIIAIAISACTGTARMSGAPFPGVEPAEANGSRLSVVIDNQHHEDVTVYLVRGTSAVRLGRVGSFESRRFAVSGSLLGSSGFIEMTATPLGSASTAHLQQTPVKAGQLVEWRLGINLRHSTVMVR